VVIGHSDNICGKEFFDVTLDIKEQMISWPDDPKVEFVDASYNACKVTRVSLPTHIGTHIDAPSHVIEGASNTGSMELGRLCGISRVCSLEDVNVINAEVLSRLDLRGVERLLLKTANSRKLNSGSFQQDYVFLTEDAADFLLNKAVKLLAFDYLSVDSYFSQKLPVHRKLLSAGIVILEGVNLNGVPPGDYEMFCLPLKISADGAPARVILRCL